MNEEEKKDLLIRQFITKICETKEIIDIKYDKEFLGKWALLIKKINERRKDVPSVKYLKDTYKFEPAESEYTLRDITESLNRHYVLEKTNTILKDYIQTRKNGVDSNDSITSLDALSKQFSAIRGVVSKSSVIDIANETDKVVGEYKKLQENISFVKTGFSYIDSICKPKIGDYVMLCGGSGSGKSLLMTCMQKAAHDAGVPSLYCSLEMSLLEVTNRFMAAKGICKAEELNSYKFPPEEYEKFLKQLKDTNTHILTRTTESKINVQTIERYITELKPKVLFLDYLTLLQDSDFSWNAENPVSTEIKRLALQYDVLIVTAVQADSSPEIRNGEIPEMYNVRGNKSFPHDANIFIGFASERKLTDQDTFRFRFGIKKNRNGGIADFAYEINPNKGTIVDITDSIASGL